MLLCDAAGGGDFLQRSFEDSLEVYDETRNLFNPITIEDYTGFTADQKQSIEAKATENGLLFCQCAAR